MVLKVFEAFFVIYMILMKIMIFGNKFVKHWFGEELAGLFLQNKSISIWIKSRTDKQEWL